MKKQLTVFLLILWGASIYAAGTFPGQSAAATDGLMAPLVNPAATAIGNAGGIGYIFGYDEDYKNSKENYLLFNSDKASFVYHKNDGREDYLLNFAFSPLKNLYIGNQLNWSKWYSDSLHFNAGVIYRPYNFVSAAAMWKNYTKESDEQSYNFGLGLRPLPLNGDFYDRITLTADWNYVREDWEKPTLGISTEFLDGLVLGGNYNFENETAMLNFELSQGFFKIGNMLLTDDEGKRTNGYGYVHLGSKGFRNLVQRSGNNFYNYNLKGTVFEQRPYFKVGPFAIFTSEGKELKQVIGELKELKEDKNIQGIVFKSGNISCSMAQLTELKDALLDFKASGKKVIYYYESISNANYVLAAATADRIYLNPLGEVDLHGISVTQPYFRGLLDTLGVEVYNFRSHKYKSAGNSFSEKEMTAAEREEYNYLLQGFYDEMLSMIEQGRGNQLKDTVENLIDNGPYFRAEDALQKGLIDGIIYEDELSAKIKSDFHNARLTDKAFAENYDYTWSKKPEYNIAVIYAVGNIISGKGQNGKTIGSQTTSALIKKARENKNIDAIILRIDSGGGSALASDIISREVELTRRAGKPIVASMSGVAASGGYYIAAKTDKIIAEPTTLTGSIGVVGMVPNYKKLSDKLHINWSTVKKGEHADLGNAFRPMSDEEKEMITSSIENVYWRFVDVVADGRNLPKEEVHKIAQGRVWTGKQAKERGLVDELGGMNKAVETILQLGKTAKQPNLIYLQHEKFDFQVDMQLPFGMSMSMPKALRQLKDQTDVLLSYEDEIVLTIMPYYFELNQ